MTVQGPRPQSFVMLKIVLNGGLDGLQAEKNPLSKRGQAVIRPFLEIPGLDPVFSHLRCVSALSSRRF